MVAHVRNQLRRNAKVWPYPSDSVKQIDQHTNPFSAISLSLGTWTKTQTPDVQK
jgi:hypothetical protein